MKNQDRKDEKVKMDVDDDEISLRLRATDGPGPSFCFSQKFLAAVLQLSEELTAKSNRPELKGGRKA